MTVAVLFGLLTVVSWPRTWEVAVLVPRQNWTVDEVTDEGRTWPFGGAPFPPSTRGADDCGQAERRGSA